MVVVIISMLKPNAVTNIQKLRSEGLSIYKISKKTGYDYKTIKKHLIPEKPEQSSKPVLKQSNEKLVEDKPFSSVKKPSLLSDDDGTDEAFIRQYDKPEDAAIEVRGLPVSRKIQITPKNLTMFQWFKSRYNFEGDLGDFLNDCASFFFKNGVGARMEVKITDELN